MKITAYIDVDKSGPYASTTGLRVHISPGPFYMAAPNESSRRYAVTFEVPHPLDAEPISATDVTEVKP
jgi:hypothetical protein